MVVANTLGELIAFDSEDLDDLLVCHEDSFLVELVLLSEPSEFSLRERQKLHIFQVYTLVANDARIPLQYQLLVVGVLVFGEVGVS